MTLGFLSPVSCCFSLLSSAILLLLTYPERGQMPRIITDFPRLHELEQKHSNTQEASKKNPTAKCHLSQQGIRVSPRHWVQNHLSWPTLLHLGYSSGWTMHGVKTQLSLITLNPSLVVKKEPQVLKQDSASSFRLRDKESWGNPVMTPPDFDTHGLANTICLEIHQDSSLCQLPKNSQNSGCSLIPFLLIFVVQFPHFQLSTFSLRLKFWNLPTFSVFPGILSPSSPKLFIF